MSENFYIKKLEPFVGYKLAGFALDDSDPHEEYFGLILQKGKDKRIVWILRDDEGNGPGSIDITAVS